MLLPVIMQHHRHKKSSILTKTKAKNGNVNNDNIPIDIELISVRSTKTMLDDLTDNINSIFASETLRRFIYKYDDNDINKQSCVDAHNCIAHLLDNTP
ncbi:unnamed protein product [Rotaria sp. Silwood1]|nr:unnamed protein product [Rotaria sp. Silwood1]CAF3793894.1 unnamed protein product [Rotaria sp. Silwood1]CAF3824117.1 unnamed protein product [Rotaria sp. Silwood1]CAF4774441.1 unnamed protein product [Rotaria sp. Silwood1]CAF4888972.1 unnamed protein product [Rotaria sp. Silwood1]